MLQTLHWPQGTQSLEKQSDQQTLKLVKIPTPSLCLVPPHCLSLLAVSPPFLLSSFYRWNTYKYTFLVSLQVPGQTQIQLGFGFLNPIPECWNRVSLLFPGHLLFFHLLYIFFSHLSFFRTNLSTHAGLVLTLSDFHFIRMDDSFKTNYLSRTPLSSRAITHGILPGRSLNRQKSALMKSKRSFLISASSQEAAPHCPLSSRLHFANNE